MRTMLFGIIVLAASSVVACALEGARYQVILHPISGWAKICNTDTPGKTACYLSRHFGRDPKKPPILDLSITDIEGEAGHVARFLLPVGLETDRGLMVSIDGGERQSGRFEACVPNGCFAQVPLANAALAAMKKGGTMQVTTSDTKGRRVDFYLSLDGFSAAYGGAGVDARSVAPPRAAIPGKPTPPKARGTGI